MRFGCAALAAAGGAAFAPAGLIARRGVLFDRALLVRAAGAGSRAAIGGHVVEHAAVQRQFAAGDVLFATMSSDEFRNSKKILPFHLKRELNRELKSLIEHNFIRRRHR